MATCSQCEREYQRESNEQCPVCGSVVIEDVAAEEEAMSMYEHSQEIG